MAICVSPTVGPSTERGVGADSPAVLALTAVAAAAAVVGVDPVAGVAIPAVGAGPGARVRVTTTSRLMRSF